MDDKFLNLPLDQWNLIRNLSVNNFITFELRQDTSIYYYNKPFTCTLKVSIRYFTSRDQLKPTEINDISLVVRYDTATGKFYPLYDRYSFKNAYKVTVVVNSITSPEWGEDLPAVFRIKTRSWCNVNIPLPSRLLPGYRWRRKSTPLLLLVTITPEEITLFSRRDHNMKYPGTLRIFQGLKNTMLNGLILIIW